MKIKCPYCNSNDITLDHLPLGASAVCTCNMCGSRYDLQDFISDENQKSKNDPVNAPSHYTGKIECIDYLRDKLTKEEFTGFCMGNVLKYSSRWRKKDGLQDLKKAKVYLEWAIENEAQE